MQRARQLDLLCQWDLFDRAWLAAFMLEKDQLFARLTLNRAELELHEQRYAHVKVTAPTPDLVVYLQAPVNVLLQRIYMRGRSYEQHLAPDCLERVCQSYAEFFSSYSDAPLLMINALEIDFVANEEDLWALLAQIRAVHGG
jgi:deoxyguanosine kinase